MSTQRESLAFSENSDILRFPLLALTMAWNFRKSASFGPLRLNFSKRGVGYSVGVRGLRFGKDARNRTYSQSSLPGTGIYNRQYGIAQHKGKVLSAALIALLFLLFKYLLR